MEGLDFRKGALLVGLVVAGCAPQDSVKNTHVDPEWLALHKRIRSEVSEGEQTVFADLQAGRWSHALAMLGTIEPHWAPAKQGFPPSYREYRAEALIGQGQATRALETLRGLPDRYGDPSPMTYDLAGAMTGELDPDVAFAHAEHARLDFSSQGAPPPMKRPTTIAEMVACVRLDRAVANRSSDVVAEREAREVLKVYPKQPIASYILVKSLIYQKRAEETNPYWEAALVLPGSPGQEAKAVCHNLYPDRHEFDPTPPGPSVERSGPITPGLQAEADRQRAIHEGFRRKP